MEISEALSDNLSVGRDKTYDARQFAGMYFHAFNRAGQQTSYPMGIILIYFLAFVNSPMVLYSASYLSLLAL